MRFGFANTTDYDFLIPAPLAFLLLVNSLEMGARLNLRFNPRGLTATLAGVFFFLVLNIHYETVSAWSPLFFTVVWFSLITAIAVSSFCLWLRPRDYLSNPNHLALIPCVLIGSSFYFYANHFRWLWNLLGGATAGFLHAMFSFLNISSVTTAYTAEEALRIDHALLSLRIGKGCGGGDAFFYFTLTFLLVSLLFWSGERLFRWFGVFLGGVALMFLLNVVRIVLLFIGGIWLRDYFGHELGTGLFKSIFHLHIGWFLYTVGIFGYLKISAHLMRWNVRSAPPLVTPSLSASST